MDQKEFDQIIKERLRDIAPEPTEAGWAALQQRMRVEIPTSESSVNDEGITKFTFWSRIRPITKYAAVLLPLIGAAIWFFNQGGEKPNTTIANNTNTVENSTNTNNNPSADQATTPNTNSSSDNNSNIASTSNQNNAPSSTQTSPGLSNTNSNARTPLQLPLTNKQAPAFAFENVNKNKNRAATTLGDNNNTPENPNAIVPENNNAINSVATVQNSNVNDKKNDKKNDLINDDKIIVAENKSKTNDINNTNATNNAVRDSSAIAKQYQSLDLSTPTPLRKVQPKLTNNTIGVLAGTGLINADSRAANLNIGVQTERKINDRFYFDGAISYVNNSPMFAQNFSSRENTIDTKALNTVALSDQLNAYGVNPAENNFRAGGNNIPVNELQSDSSIMKVMSYRLASNQLQALPMLGFKINRRFSLAGGVDVSRTLVTQKVTEAVSHLRLFTTAEMDMRKWDAGFLAKAEVNITKKIAIGYRQRLGLVNTVAGNSGGINLRRNYSDLVFKFNVR